MDKNRKKVWLNVGTIALLVTLITVLHFKTGVEHPHLHQIYQRSYYIPIVLAGYLFEILGGLVTASVLAIVFFIHIWKDWSHHPEYALQQYAEIPMYLVIALLVGYLSRVQRKTRQSLEKTGAELSAAYQKLSDTFDQLRHADRLAALGQISAGIAHEIRNPLASIQGAVEILEQDVPNATKAEFVQIARKEIARLERLTGEFLQFSRPAPPQKSAIDPREPAEAACRLVADQARRQGVVISRQFDEPEIQILADPEQLKQVMINILINALQAQPHGGSIAVVGRVASGEWIATIQDEGPGMDSEQLGRIFDPFYTTKREGTGLGLSISHQLVRNNGGRIWATSEPGKGCCFHIAFPV